MNAQELNLYVDPAYTGVKQDGRQAYPFTSVGNAIAFAKQFHQCGRPIQCKIQLAAGTYTEHVRVDEFNAYLFIVGNKNNSGNYVFKDGMRFYGCPDVYIEGVTIKAGNSYNCCVAAINSAVEVNNCNIVIDANQQRSYINARGLDEIATDYVIGLGATKGSVINSRMCIFTNVDCACAAYKGSSVTFGKIGSLSNIAVFAKTMQGQVIYGSAVDINSVASKCTKSGVSVGQGLLVNDGTILST